MGLIKKIIDNIIHNTIYQTNHCRYHVFFTYKYDSYNMTPTSLFHVTSYQKINNDDDNMSLIKYNFFQNTASCTIKKHYLEVENKHNPQLII